jgi:hypothetical protein
VIRKMRTQKDRKIVAASLILMLTIIMTLGTLPTTVQALEIPTYLILSVAPNPVGMNQPVYVGAFMSKPTPTASFVYGDLYANLTIQIVRPDGTKETKGPFLGDAVGGTWFTYVPTTAGDYTFQAFYPGQTLTGSNPRYPQQNGTNPQVWGSILKPSVSAIVKLTVQKNPISSYSSPPLPTGYWSRPIIATNYAWAQLGGSWLGLRASTFASSGMYDAVGNFQPYTTAPNTAHILWTKPTAFGGQVGAPINADLSSQFMSTSIATNCFEPIIIYGILFYVHYPEMTAHKASWIAVDLRTGEEVWNKPCGITGDEILRCGQVVQYDSIQEYGANAYLWSVSASGNTTLRLYDPMTCTYVAEIVNGTQNVAMISDYSCVEQGTLLGWYTSGSNLYLWNSTRAIAYPTAASERPQRTYRPSGSIAWSAGIEWTVPCNFTIAGASTGNLAIGARTPEVILLRTAPTLVSQAAAGYQITAGIDARTGRLLWGPLNQTIPAYQDIGFLTARDGVYILHNKDTNEAYGYSLKTGQPLWGPVQLPGNAWSSIARGAEIAYGNVYIWDYGGYLNALDIQTGAIKWTWTPKSAGYNTPYGVEPLWQYSQSICDGKLFLSEGKLYDPPMSPEAQRLVINATTGELIWSILSWSCRIPAAHADGMMVQWNSYDKQIDTFGKGQTATTASIQNDVIAQGNGVLIKGMVTDESPGTKNPDRIARFPHGVPAVADASMSPWMEYVYMQQPKPNNATGVPVKLQVVDPNGNIVDLGTVTSDIDGQYAFRYTPRDQGLYKVIATFAGSESYFESYGTTYFSVGPAAGTVAPTPAVIAPTPTSITTTPTSSPTATPSVAPIGGSGAGIGSEVYIAIAAVVIIIAIAAAAVILRRRK